MSPTTKTSGWPGQREVGLHRRPGRPGRAARRTARRAGVPSGRPATPAAQTLVTASIRRCVPSRVLDVDAGASTSSTIAPSCTSMPSSSSALGGLRAEPARRTAAEHRGSRRRRARSARVRGVDAAEVPAQRAAGQLGDLAGHLDAGRAGADHDEGEQPRRPAAGSLGRARRARTRRRSGRAARARRRCVFSPGANSANWSLPKYDWLAPAATIRRVVRRDRVAAEHVAR